MTKDVARLTKSNESMVKETAQWRQAFSSMAMVQSCTTEYLAIQTALERRNNKIRSHLQQVTESVQAWVQSNE